MDNVVLFWGKLFLKNKMTYFSHTDSTTVKRWLKDVKVSFKMDFSF